MIKNYNIPVTEGVQIFQVWLSSINWTLGKNQLTNIELEVFSYLLYYNNQFASITDYNLRMDLLFSSSIKKKIKKEFNISSTKFETYLNKLRNKGIIENNIINSKFVIYPTNKIQVIFNCFLENNEITNSISIISRDLESQDSSVIKHKDNNKDNSVIKQKGINKSNSVIEQEDTNIEDDLEEINEDDHDFINVFDKYFTDNEENKPEPWM